MDAAKKIILFVALVMVCAVTASASIPRAPENRVGEIFAPSAKPHRFESLQLHQSQWDAQAFSLQIALDLTIDADGRLASATAATIDGAIHAVAQFNDMLSLGYTSAASDPWATPLATMGAYDPQLYGVAFGAGHFAPLPAVGSAQAVTKIENIVSYGMDFVQFGLGAEKIVNPVGYLPSALESGSSLAPSVFKEVPVVYLEVAQIIDPSVVRFTQDSIGSTFKNGQSLDDVARALRDSGGEQLASQFPPIRLVQFEGQLFTLDNRRLAAFSAGGQQVPYRMATPAEISAEWASKFTTTGEQGFGQFITVRPTKP